MGPLRSSWSNQLDSNKEMISLYVDFLPEAKTYEQIGQITEEIRRLLHQNEYILQMKVTEYLSKDDFFNIRAPSIINQDPIEN